MRSTALALILLATAAWADGHRAAELLTPKLASELLGRSVALLGAPAPDASNADGWVSGVAYAVQSGPAALISLTLRRSTTQAEASAMFQQFQSNSRGQEVAGLGYPAFRVPFPAQLDVLKGRDWVIIKVGTEGSPNNAAQIRLAKLILPRIHT